MPSPTSAAAAAAASSTTTTHLRHLYRALLRELPARPVLARPRPPLHRYLRTAFARPAPRAPGAVAAAGQLAAYLRSQRQYAALLERYNPGMRDVDQAEHLRLTARRVGLSMPVAHGKPGRGT